MVLNNTNLCLKLYIIRNTIFETKIFNFNTINVITVIKVNTIFSSINVMNSTEIFFNLKCSKFYISNDTNLDTKRLILSC